jgi:hypothetical protein
MPTWLSLVTRVLQNLANSRNDARNCRIKSAVGSVGMRRNPTLARRAKQVNAIFVPPMSMPTKDIAIIHASQLK